MFGEWEQLVVRLDFWHRMRHFARGVHHRVFMSQLSFRHLWVGQRRREPPGRGQALHPGSHVQRAGPSLPPTHQGHGGDGAAHSGVAGHHVGGHRQHGRPSHRPGQDGGHLEHAASPSPLHPITNNGLSLSGAQMDAEGGSKRFLPC